MKVGDKIKVEVEGTVIGVSADGCTASVSLGSIPSTVTHTISEPATELAASDTGTETSGAS